MKVVVLGGGFCGSMVAKRFDQVTDIDTVLVDKKDHFTYYPSLPKLINDPSYQKNITNLYSEFLENTDIITENIEKISPENVSTAKNRIGYDILVICLGADYPIDLDDERDVFTIRSVEEVKRLSEHVEVSKNILIVGGGLIGVETAAELATKTEKKITLVHSHDRLLERESRTASWFAEKFLRGKGVEVIFGRKVVGRKDRGFKTEDGRTIDADVCIWSTGLGYDKSIFEGFDRSIFAENGSLRVNEYLQLRGYPNIFVGGDITAINEEKTGHNADAHSRIISDNIIRMEKEKPLKKYSHFKIPLVIGLGDINGLISLPRIGIPGPVAPVIKYILEKGALLRL
ncbi:MAG: NAD(P)/FAD-dependent oxidoreductase [Thermoplasmatota archaeon]